MSTSFIKNLFRLANEDEHVRWVQLDKGDCISLLNIAECARQCSLNKQRHTSTDPKVRARSFVRQLNYYGFHKVPLFKSPTPSAPSRKAGESGATGNARRAGRAGPEHTEDEDSTGDDDDREDDGGVGNDDDCEDDGGVGDDDDCEDDGGVGDEDGDREDSTEENRVAKCKKMLIYWHPHFTLSGDELHKVCRNSSLTSVQLHRKMTTIQERQQELALQFDGLAGTVASIAQQQLAIQQAIAQLVAAMTTP